LASLALLTLFLAASASAQSASRDVVVGKIDGIVNPAMSSYVDRVITDAERSNAPAVVFSMNTPGGLSDATRDINQRIERSNVPVIVYVPPSGDRANLQPAEALHAQIVNSTASDLPDLLRQADGATVQVASGPVTLHTAGAPTRPADMSALESFLHTITNPTIAYILLSMGSLGLLLELYHPGAIFPGIFGGICLLLAFYALGTLPLNFTGLALIAFGVLLFGLEPLLTAHGILAVGGAVAFVLGSIMLINAPDAPFLQVSRPAIAGVTALLVAFFGFLVSAVIRARRRQVVTGREGLIGASGVVRRDIVPGRTGIVLVQGELWQAVSTEGRLSEGEAIRVRSVEGLTLTVRRATDLIPAPPRPTSPALAKSKAARV
jgi:membrane-bound ClpP family serine protease